MNWSVLKTWLLPPRSQRQELLDAEDIPPRDLAGNLDDLSRLNRYLGSHWLICTTLHRVWRDLGCPEQLRVLDVGTGAGDIPLALYQWSQRQGVRLTLVAIDNHPDIVHATHGVVSLQPVDLIQADGLFLPFRPQTFDVVICSTMLHHLEWPQATALLQAMATVARHGMIVNDLRRSWFHYGSAWLLLAVISRNRLTRHDGPLSVLRAYCVDEVRQMASMAGLQGARVSPVLGYRWLLVYTPKE
jgi:2-polyprenyl-3-methyl-5-hydroxy-6-metoxy-1,4-benzoquinol methylase